MRMLAAAAFALACTGAWAQTNVMYRCTDAQGAVTLQNDVPCPKGSKQVKRVIDAPQSAPANAAPPAPSPAAPSVPAVAAPAAAAPATPSTPVKKPEAAPAPPIVDRQPPPAVFRCVTHQKEQYFSDTDLQPSRCLPLQTVGLDGNPGTGTGAACEMVKDRCERIADSGLCEVWQQRLHNAESKLRFGEPAQAATAREESNRAEKVLRESTCSQ